MKTDDSTLQKNVSNVMGTVRISDKLDLYKIFLSLENTSYEPEQFSGVIYRNEEPPGTAILFSSGKVICTGAKDEKSVKKIISDLVDKLRFLDVPVYQDFNVQIRNIVFTKALGKPINLSRVALSFGLENVDYEPSNFPGLVYKIEEPKVTFILFESGKIICTGTRSGKDAEIAYKGLERKLKRKKVID